MPGQTQPYGLKANKRLAEYLGRDADRRASRMAHR